MDGLEVSEINLSDLERTGRVDAEFYQKGNLFVEKILNKWDRIAISECFNVSDGNHMSISDSFSSEGVPYYRGQDIYNLFIENSNPLYISQEAYDKPLMRRSYLKKGDVLISIVGTIGNSALVTSDRQATCSCKLAILRSNNKGIFPETMLIFIKTKYGQSQIQKFRRGAVQTGLLLEDFDQLFVPKFSNEIQNICKVFVDKAKSLMDESTTIYNEAEELLIETLGLKGFSPKNEVCSIKSFKDSFGKLGRIDAEYYQTNYEDYDNLLKKYYNGYGLIGDVCTIKDKNYIPDNKIEYSYIELANVGRQGNISNCAKIYGLDLPTRARRIVSTNDVIISSVEGSLEKCALITSDYNGYVCTNGFYVINCDCINSETLMILFKSKPIQTLMKRGCSGTILSAIGKEELIKIPLPIITSDIQQKIKNLVTKSNATRKRSEELLNKAIKIVEIAVEQGEEVALKMLI